LPALLIQEACLFFDVDDWNDIYRRTRKRNVTYARWAIAYTLFNHFGWIKGRIAKLLVKRRFSIINGIAKAEALRKTDPIFFEALQRLEKVRLP